MNISKKVLDFMKLKNYLGIYVTYEIKACGWAGPSEIIRGEFIKNNEELEEILKNKHILEYDVSDVKVLITDNLKNKKINIVSAFKFFNMFMSLGIDVRRK